MRNNETTPTKGGVAPKSNWIERAVNTEFALQMKSI